MNTYFGYPDLPIKQVYLNYNCNTGQKMWDPMAVINAVEGDELFNFSPWGVVTFHPDATTTFVANPAGRHRYQEPGILKWSEDMLQEIRDYTSLCPCGQRVTAVGVRF